MWLVDEASGERRPLPAFLAGRVVDGDRVVVAHRSWLVTAEHGDERSR